MHDTDESDPPLTVGPVARLLNKSESRVRQMADVGILPSTLTTSGVRLFRRIDVERLISTQDGPQHGRRQ